MMLWRKYAVVGALFLGLTAENAQAQQLQPIRVHMHASEGYAADGILYSPSGAPPFTAIVLIPDDKGITQRITETASDLLSQGYLVVALDLNRGQSPDAATHSDEQSMHDLDATMTFLSAQSSVARDAIGLVGWQSGGAYALEYAVDPRIKAVAIIDTTSFPERAHAAPLRAPIFAAFAGRGASATQLTVKTLRAEAGRLGSTATVKLYPNAAIGFDDSEDGARYRAADAADLRKRELDFFSQHLHR